MSGAFAASVRALALPDEAALVKATGRGELEARVREYARAEAAAPVDVQAEVGSIHEVWKHYDAEARAAAQAGTEEMTRSAEDMCRILEGDRERLQVAGAARREWAEATAGVAEPADIQANLEAADVSRPRPIRMQISKSDSMYRWSSVRTLNEGLRPRRAAGSTAGKYRNRPRRWRTLPDTLRLLIPATAIFSNVSA